MNGRHLSIGVGRRQVKESAMFILKFYGNNVYIVRISGTFDTINEPAFDSLTSAMEAVHVLEEDFKYSLTYLP